MVVVVVKVRNGGRVAEVRLVEYSGQVRSLVVIYWANSKSLANKTKLEEYLVFCLGFWLLLLRRSL